MGSKMFLVDGKPMKTWNPFKGCLFFCIYCWARDLAEGKLSHLDKYWDGFFPAFHEREIKRKFKPGQFVAVSLMGDVYWAKPEWRDAILERIGQFLDTNFLFQSKAPVLFNSADWPKLENIYYGTTIETNRDYGLSLAPPPYDRYRCFAGLSHARKLVSIEPICDFDLEVMVKWMREIKPEIIEVGADNYRHHLPEPPWSKVAQLLKELGEICPNVVEKEGLERLRG